MRSVNLHLFTREDSNEGLPHAGLVALAIAMAQNMARHNVFHCDKYMIPHRRRRVQRGLAGQPGANRLLCLERETNFFKQ